MAALSALSGGDLQLFFCFSFLFYFAPLLPLWEAARDNKTENIGRSLRGALGFCRPHDVMTCAYNLSHIWRNSALKNSNDLKD